MVKTSLAVLSLVVLGLFITASAASAQTLAPQDRLCDPTFEDCRADILTYIQQETVEIDMAFWAMSDARYSNALVAAWNRGVRVRLLVDPRCAAAHEACQPSLDQLAGAGIPMRNRIASGILHWKMIVFASQQQVEFAGANYTPYELVPEIPYDNYTDEVVDFTSDASLVHSFMTRFDDLWTSTTEFGDYANVTAPLTRSYPVSPIDPRLNFPPDQSYRSRATAAYAAEQQAIDVLMFRITDERETDAIIAQMNRGIPVRLISDTSEYRNKSRLWDAYNVDKLYHAGAQVRLSDHQGINHEKAVVLRGTGMVIFGSSNWTSPSTDSQREHNLFTTEPWMFDWLSNQFIRKWTNGTGNTETKAFVPLPPDAPLYNAPARSATGVATSGVSLTWNAGVWGQIYDIYFGTTPNPPLLAADQKLGPSQYGTDYRTYALSGLQPGTTYYWKIVSKTMAYVTATGPVWSFTTAGTAPGNAAPSVSITSPANNASFSAPADITIAASASDSDGTIARVDFYQGSTLIGTDTTSPYSVTWSSVPAGTYSLTAVATDNGNASATSAAIRVTVNTSNTLPTGWQDADIGPTGATGGSSYNGAYTVLGAGADVWGTADAFHYAWTSLTGDGSIVARVASIQYVHAWTKAGVMMRNSTSPSAAQAFMLVAASASKGAPFQRRTADGNTSVSTSGPLVTAPYWVKLVRTGDVISGYASADGTTWTQVGSDTFTMDATILVGLALSSHVSGTNAQATFDHVSITSTAPSNVPPSIALTSPSNGASYTEPATIAIRADASDSDGSVAKVDFYANGNLIATDTTAPYEMTWSNVTAGWYTLSAIATDDGGATTATPEIMVGVNPPSPGLPGGWTQADVNDTGVAGSGTYANGVFTVQGAGSDVWGTADYLHYVWTGLDGDGTIVARVSSEQYVANWTKAGVMIRGSLSASSPQAFMLVSPGKGVAFQRRRTEGDVSYSTSGTMSAAPRWVKLVRAGDVISAYESADGVTWQLVGTDTFTMQTSVFFGLAVSSHVKGTNATATFDSVTVTPGGTL